MAYTDIATVKSYLGGNAPAGADALLTGFVAAAQSIIDAYCHQPFEAAADSTRFFDPLQDGANGYGYGYSYGAAYGYNGAYGGGRRLYLDYPLCAVTSITNGDGTTLAPTDYVTEPRNLTPWYAISIKLNSSKLWTYTGSPENSIAILGRWAYSVLPPADIQQAAVRLASFLFYQRDNGIDLDRILQTASGVAIPPDLPRDVCKMLEPYKRIVI